MLLCHHHIHLHRCWSSPTSADLPPPQQPLPTVASYPSLLIDRLWNIHITTSTAISIMTIDHGDFIHFIHSCMHECLYVYISMLIKTAEVIRDGHSAMYVRKLQYYRTYNTFASTQSSWSPATNRSILKKDMLLWRKMKKKYASMCGDRCTVDDRRCVILTFHARHPRRSSFHLNSIHSIAYIA